MVDDHAMGGSGGVATGITAARAALWAAVIPTMSGGSGSPVAPLDVELLDDVLVVPPLEVPLLEVPPEEAPPLDALPEAPPLDALPDVPPELLDPWEAPPLPLPAPWPEVVEDPPAEALLVDTWRWSAPVMALHADAPPATRRRHETKPRAA
jgi:hypothetical protein